MWNFFAYVLSDPIARPTVQVSASHSRLVTTKLTATPQPSTTTGPGWSLPSSVNPSVSPSPPASNANGPSVASAPAAPQLPHAGKVIQPQHRATTNSGSLKKDGSGKPVWGNVRGGVSSPDTRVQDDFPTAAEVANGTFHVQSVKTL
jgi:serine/arginine repetitive matrix protein 2